MLYVIYFRNKWTHSQASLLHHALAQRAIACGSDPDQLFPRRDTFPMDLSKHPLTWPDFHRAYRGDLNFGSISAHRQSSVSVASVCVRLHWS